MMNVKKRPFTSPENRIEFLNDVRKLQLSCDEQMFEKGCALFLQKWKRRENVNAIYFEKTYVKMNNHWYEGVQARVPKTNNCTENFNKSIKAHQTFYQRKPVAEFIFAALKMIEQRSKAYIKDLKPPQMSVTATKKLQLEGWELSKPGKLQTVHEKATNGDIHYYIYNDPNKKITMNNVRATLNRKLKTFDDFSTSSIYKVCIPQAGEWKKCTCTCEMFFKDYICAHVLAIAHRINILQPPEQALKEIESAVPAKNPVGRPKKATKALIRD